MDNDLNKFSVIGNDICNKKKSGQYENTVNVCCKHVK